jgi:DNA-binding HxlR family transcriptional regulator
MSKDVSVSPFRHLRLLRDHGLTGKLPNRHRYHLTDNGRQLTTALHAMLSASTEQLLNMAA